MFGGNKNTGGRGVDQGSIRRRNNDLYAYRIL